jgi:2-haloacid dehalogenase
VTAIRFDDFGALTFDCYGTLVDWERGILSGVRPVLAAHGTDVPDDADVLEAYARYEAELEGGSYMRYRDVVAGALRGICAEHGIEPTDAEATAFGDSVGDWPPFPDSAAALVRLSERFRLGVITNCDRDLFERTRGKLQADFDWIVTAEQARGYKPSLRNFELAFETIALPAERILHVAQSLYHDHVPAKRLGMTTVWIDRRSDAEGNGATPPASAAPDATFPDMRSFADAALA